MSLDVGWEVQCYYQRHAKVVTICAKYLSQKQSIVGLAQQAENTVGRSGFFFFFFFEIFVYMMLEYSLLFSKK